MELYHRKDSMVGRFWERLVKCIKTPLKKELGRSTLDFEELRTVLVEVESVVNARPITYTYGWREFDFLSLDTFRSYLWATCYINIKQRTSRNHQYVSIIDEKSLPSGESTSTSNKTVEKGISHWFTWAVERGKEKKWYSRNLGRGYCVTLKRFQNLLELMERFEPQLSRSETTASDRHICGGSFSI